MDSNVSYIDALIAAAPVELRRYVVSRLDVTGRGYIKDGLWNYILDKTQYLEELHKES